VVFGLGRDVTGTLSLRVEGPESCALSLQIATREYRIQRVEGVPQRTVTPDPADLERIRREAALVKSARKNSSSHTYFAAGFQWPVLGPVSGVYGSQRVYNGNPGRPHYGVDVAVPKGTPVGAPAPGVVVLAEPDLFYSGGTIIIDHGSEVSSSFLHLSEVSVEVGTAVKAGEIVGKVGSTGRATGPHLDWRMNWRNRRVDPQLLVPPMP
jgi:murein DD-endopeptidase MepM/ murein hydrolase activator NlpD